MKPPPDNPAFNRLKSLAGGVWVALDDEGVPAGQVIIAYRVISAGSVVQESIFPGQWNEMQTMWHMNGDDLVATHYCALGNQPHWKVDASDLPEKLKFSFNGGTNMDPTRDMNMHEGTITFIDDDHIETYRQSYENGKPTEVHTVHLKLARKR